MRDRLFPSYRWLFALGVFLVMLGGKTALGGEGDHGSQPHHPPKTGHWIGDHWTPYDPPAPESFPEGARVYRIQKKDTLWDLAENFYADPYLWPQIWDANRYILDSHWIYPGDPLLIPSRPTVVAEVLPQADQPVASSDTGPIPLSGPVPGTAPESTTDDDEISGGEDGSSRQQAAPVAEPKAKRKIAFANRTDLECLDQVVDKYRKSPLFIAQSEVPRRIAFATDDIVYLNGGEEDDIDPGDQFSITRKLGKVYHPITGKRIGEFVKTFGRLRVLSVQPRTSIAQIVFSCERIEKGFDLVPYEPIFSPVGEMPEFDYRDLDPTGNAEGYVIHGGGKIRPGPGHLIQVNLGDEEGVESGDFLNIFIDTPRPKPLPFKYKYKYRNQEYTSFYREDKGKRDYPRRIVGHAVVLSVSARTSVVKILDSIREIEVGDHVEIR